MPISRRGQQKIKRSLEGVDNAELKKSLQSYTTELRRLNANLSTIKEQLKPRHFFLNGILRGVGALIGATLLIVGVTYILDILGVFPVIGDAARAIRELLDFASTRRL